MISPQYVDGLEIRIAELQADLGTWQDQALQKAAEAEAFMLERDSWREQFRVARGEELELRERVAQLSEMLHIAVHDGPQGYLEWVDSAIDLLRQSKESDDD